MVKIPSSVLYNKSLFFFSYVNYIFELSRNNFVYRCLKIYAQSLCGQTVGCIYTIKFLVLTFIMNF